MFNIKDNDYAIDFTKMNKTGDVIEDDLLNMFMKAAGSNKILEPKEFKKWCKKNYYEINDWFEIVLGQEKNRLVEEGFIVETEIKAKTMFTKQQIKQTVQISAKEEAIKLAGLKKFLLEFSLMPEKEYYEVHLWEEYLIFAELLGIADKVEEQFSKVYPRFKEETMLKSDLEMSDLITMAVGNLACVAYEGMNEGIAYAESSSSHDYSGSSRDSGGGGSSYSSGGSSSGGSSGGGFR